MEQLNFNFYDDIFIKQLFYEKLFKNMDLNELIRRVEKEEELYGGMFVKLKF